jgi:hypothetical protein
MQKDETLQPTKVFTRISIKAIENRPRDIIASPFFARLDQ